MTTKVVKGSLWTLAGQVAPLAVSLVTTPFTIRMLGTEGYGVFILIGLIPTYLGFADFGMGMASTKFGSEAYAEGDLEKEARVVRTAALISLCTSVPIAALLMIFAGYIISLFNVPAEFTSQATLALRLASVTFVINFLCGIFNTPQLARLRMDLNTLINATSRILGLLATPIVLYLGYGIVGAITVLLIASVLNLIGHLIVSRSLLPHLVRRTIDPSTVRPAIKFGGGLIFAGIAGLLLANIEKGFLSAVSSVVELAYYSVAFVLAGVLTMFSSAMSQSLLPAFARLQLESDEIRLNNVYNRAIRINVIWLIPAAVVLAIFSRLFFSLWAGPDFGTGSTPPFFILLFGLIFHVITYLPFTAIMAAGRSDLIARIYWFELLPYLVIVGILVYNRGILGAAIAWSLRIAVDAVVLLYFANRVSGVRPSIQNVVRIVVVGFVFLVPLLLVFYFGETNFLILISVVAALMVYFYLLWRFALHVEEVAFIRQKMSSLLGRRPIKLLE